MGQERVVGYFLRNFVEEHRYRCSNADREGDEVTCSNHRSINHVVYAISEKDQWGKVARMMVGLARRDPGAALEWRAVNGRPGALFTFGGQPFAVLAIEVETGHISRVLILLSPDKLARVEAS